MLAMPEWWLVRMVLGTASLSRLAFCGAMLILRELYFMLIGWDECPPNMGSYTFSTAFELRVSCFDERQLFSPGGVTGLSLSAPAFLKLRFVSILRSGLSYRMLPSPCKTSSSAS